MRRVARRKFWSALTAGSGVAEAASIKIGAPFNVTGSLSSLDAPALNGAKLKAKEINAAGGINGKTMAGRRLPPCPAR
jgi:ABC-type branched-subunit amino acid transport system substrate-binding protein